MQTRQLATWLTQEEYESFESAWESQQQIRAELKEKPGELKRYVNKLSEATFNNNKAKRFRKKGDTDNAIKLHNLCESLCEDALEILQEIVDADASLHMWFDRGLDFGHGSPIDAQLGNLPRVVTSLSQDRQTTDVRLMSIREVKIATLEMAISVLLAVGVADTKERKERDSAKLAEFLSSPFLE